ncbi:MAG: SagB/ThcOx family dehydrogenase [Candidatus Aminicenantes bacterium]|nr:SagB/ThcOx family dehydrogenase [Candidatus Aminicenantes bacterium]
MVKNNRDFLKDSVRKRVDFSKTPQNLGVPPPPPQKLCPPEAPRIPLAAAGAWSSIPDVSLQAAIAGRRSRRDYAPDPLSLEELSYLLWATQGLRRAKPPLGNFRVVPSAGCRHALETYVACLRVEGLEKALYRYLPFGHELVEVARPEHLAGHLAEATFGQRFCGAGAATFVWTAVPARMEWRYGEASYKVIAIDAGHVCQNLYLACENIGAGTCAVAAYDQERMDELLGVDGDEEFTIYLAPVGKAAGDQEESAR